VISETELRGLARRWNVDLMLLDLDYSLGCFLAGLGRQDLAGHLRFKGGTCLRKCYLPDYRFSEDLDLTAESRLTQADLRAMVEKAVRWVENDIHQLLKHGVTLSAVVPVLPVKFAAKGMKIEEMRVSDLQARRTAFAADWQRRLTYLLPRSQSASFEDAWETVMQAMRQIAK